MQAVCQLFIGPDASQQLGGGLNLGSKSAKTRVSVSVVFVVAIGRSLRHNNSEADATCPPPPHRLPDSAGAESLTLVLVFAPEAAAFEALKRGWGGSLRCVPAASHVSLICADGGGEHLLPPRFLFLSRFKSLSSIQLREDNLEPRWTAGQPAEGRDAGGVGGRSNAALIVPQRFSRLALMW